MLSDSGVSEHTIEFSRSTVLVVCHQAVVFNILIHSCQLSDSSPIFTFLIYHNDYPYSISLTDHEVVLSLELHVLLTFVVYGQTCIAQDLLQLSDLLLLRRQVAFLSVHSL